MLMMRVLCGGEKLPTSIEECYRSHGVGWFSELARVVTKITSERVVDVGAWARSCNDQTRRDRLTILSTATSQWLISVPISENHYVLVWIIL